MSGHGKRSGLLVALVACVVLASPSARAQASPADRAAARSLFEQGRALVAERKHAEACPKFEESQKLDPGAGTLFNLADCYEATGRSASAWSMFLEVAAQSKKEGHAERENVARQRAAALVPRLCQLSVVVPAASVVDGLEIRRDATPVGGSIWGTPVAVDPGSHTVEASAPGMKKWVSTVQVAAPGGTVTVTVPKLEPGPAAEPAASVTAAAPARRPAAPVEQPAPAAWGAQRTAGLVLAGAGVVGLGVGALFLVQAKGKLDDAKAWCEGDVCWEQAGVDLHSEAVSRQTLGYVVGGVGLAMAAGGAVLYFTASRGAAEGKAARADGVRVALVPGGLTLKGVW
jgi:serine/threonine-protein kinase